MLGLRKKDLKEGDFIFARQPDGEYNKIIFGAVTGVDGQKIGVNGIIINPIGLRNKVEQGKAGKRSIVILKTLILIIVFYHSSIGLNMTTLLAS